VFKLVPFDIGVPAATAAVDEAELAFVRGVVEGVEELLEGERDMICRTHCGCSLYVRSPMRCCESSACETAIGITNVGSETCVILCEACEVECTGFTFMPIPILIPPIVIGFIAIPIELIPIGSPIAMLIPIVNGFMFMPIAFMPSTLADTDDGIVGMLIDMGGCACGFGFASFDMKLSGSAVDTPGVAELLPVVVGSDALLTGTVNADTSSAANGSAGGTITGVFPPFEAPICQIAGEKSAGELNMEEYMVAGESMLGARGMMTRGAAVSGCGFGNEVGGSIVSQVPCLRPDAERQ
jgi:hypothetical protein